MAHHSGAGDGWVDVMGVVNRTTVASRVRSGAGVWTRLLLGLGRILHMAEELLAESYRPFNGLVSATA